MFAHNKSLSHPGGNGSVDTGPVLVGGAVVGGAVEDESEVLLLEAVLGSGGTAVDNAHFIFKA